MIGKTFDYASTVPYPTMKPDEFIQDERRIVEAAFPVWYAARAAKLLYGADYHVERGPDGMIVMCFKNPMDLIYFEAKVGDA